MSLQHRRIQLAEPSSETEDRVHRQVVFLQDNPDRVHPDGVSSHFSRPPEIRLETTIDELNSLIQPFECLIVFRFQFLWSGRLCEWRGNGFRTRL